MRFMVFMIPAVYQPGQKVDANFAPPADLVDVTIYAEGAFVFSA